MREARHATSAFILGRKLITYKIRIIILQLLSRVLQCNTGKMLSLSSQALSASKDKQEGLFSLAVDESTDINDSPQLLIFVRCLSSSFELCEDFLSMETFATRTHGEDIFIAVKNACFRSGLDLKYLRGICTDGVPAMTDNQQGFVTRYSDIVSVTNKEICLVRIVLYLCKVAVSFVRLATG